MQKNLSQSERYIGGIHRNVKANLVAGAIIVLVMIIVHLMSGCEPVLPEISADKAINCKIVEVFLLFYRK